MSKKLEALEQIKASHETAHIDSENYGDFEVWFEDYYKIIEKALTPPTEEEVCKALNEYFGQTIVFNSGSFMNERETAEVCAIGNLGLVYFNEHLSPHLITLIGRFYEGFNE